jgi:hypothetical protein
LINGVIHHPSALFHARIALLLLEKSIPSSNTPRHYQDVLLNPAKASLSIFSMHHGNLCGARVYSRAPRVSFAEASVRFP